VTRHPTAEWLARQITVAFPWTSAPAYLVGDNDPPYGHVFTSQLRTMSYQKQAAVTTSWAANMAMYFSAPPARGAGSRSRARRPHDIHATCIPPHGSRSAAARKITGQRPLRMLMTEARVKFKRRIAMP
jgi:hypothetical protein